MPSSALPRPFPHPFGSAAHQLCSKAGSLPHTLCLTHSLAPSTLCKLWAPADHRCYKLPLSNPPSKAVAIKSTHRPPSVVVKNFSRRAGSCQFLWRCCRSPVGWCRSTLLQRARAGPWCVGVCLTPAALARDNFPIPKWWCFHYTSDTNRNAFLPAVVNTLPHLVIAFLTMLLYRSGVLDTTPGGWGFPSKVCEPREEYPQRACTTGRGAGKGT